MDKARTIASVQETRRRRHAGGRGGGRDGRKGWVLIGWRATKRYAGGQKGSGKETRGVSSPRNW